MKTKDQDDALIVFICGLGVLFVVLCSLCGCIPPSQYDQDMKFYLALGKVQCETDKLIKSNGK